MTLTTISSWEWDDSPAFAAVAVRVLIHRYLGIIEGPMIISAVCVSPTVSAGVEWRVSMIVWLLLKGVLN